MPRRRHGHAFAASSLSHCRLPADAAFDAFAAGDADAIYFADCRHVSPFAADRLSLPPSRRWLFIATYATSHRAMPAAMPAFAARRRSFSFTMFTPSFAAAECLPFQFPVASALRFAFATPPPIRRFRCSQLPLIDTLSFFISLTLQNSFIFEIAFFAALRLRHCDYWH
jgi:hypothetical protein